MEIENPLLFLSLRVVQCHTVNLVPNNLISDYYLYVLSSLPIFSSIIFVLLWLSFLHWSNWALLLIAIGKQRHVLMAWHVWICPLHTSLTFFAFNTSLNLQHIRLWWTASNIVSAQPMVQEDYINRLSSWVCLILIGPAKANLQTSTAAGHNVPCLLSAK